MGTTQPIRNKTDLQNFMDYYKQQQPDKRNYALIVFGLHTALRISDILDLRWQNLYQFDCQRYVQHISVHEKKTGKQTLIALNPHVIEALDDYRLMRQPNPGDYIFSKHGEACKPLCRSQAYRIIKKAATHTVRETHISCHSLRKTFGYHAWKQGTSPILLMDIYNHSSFRITQRYLGIEQDDRDLLFQKLEF